MESNYAFSINDIFGIDEFNKHLRKTKQEKSMHYRFSFGPSNKYHVDFKSVEGTYSSWTAEINDKIANTFDEAKDELLKVVNTIKECILEFANPIGDLEKEDVDYIYLGIKLDKEDRDKNSKILNKDLFDEIDKEAIDFKSRTIYRENTGRFIYKLSRK
jgi:hypothetical protein